MVLWTLQSYSQASPDQPNSRIKSISNYLDEALALSRIDLDEAGILANKAKTLSENYDKYWFIKSQLVICQIEQNKGNIDLALEIMQPIMQEIKELNNDTLLGRAYHATGRSFQFKGSNELALEYYLMALEIHENLKLYGESVKQLNNIGLIYREEGNYDQAIDYLNRCIEMSKKSNNELLKFISYGNVGYVAMKQGKFELAIERFNQTIEISKEKNDAISESTGYYLMAEVKYLMGDFKEAISYANKGLSLSIDSKNTIGIIYSKRILSEVARSKRNFPKAIKLAKEAQSLLYEQNTFVYFDDVMNTLFNAEYEAGNYKNALEVKIELSKRRDSLNLVKTKEKIANSEYKYQLYLNEQENELLKIQNESKTKTISLGISIVLLIGLVSSMVLIAYRKSKSYNTTLKLAIDERTKELVETNKELERFTYITAHDLKEPTRNIVSYSSLIDRKLIQKDYDAVAEYAGILSKNSTQLYKLIDKIMKFSSITKEEQLDKTEIQLGNIIEEIKELLADTLNKENVNIKYTNLPSIQGDSSLILILFKNLIENAIKYNENSLKTIEIGLRGNKIFIKDNGIGIPKEYHAKIFEMFKKLHSKHEYDGSGLGLSICQRIANLHNYNIDIESEVNKGSTFLLNPIS